jgi:hypothetical protein
MSHTIVGFQHRWIWFESRLGYVRFAVDIWAMGASFLQVLPLPLPNIPPIATHPSTGAGIMCHLVASLILESVLL